MPPVFGPPRSLTADRGDSGRRLDLVLRRHLTDVAAATRTRVQAWIANGQVTVNGTPIRRSSTRTAFGDVVTIALPPAPPPAVMSAEEVELRVLYEDAHLLAIDKPAGVVVHPTYKNTAGTLMNALLWRARGWPAGERPSLVGRLDKLTSGIVLVARSAAMHAALQRTLAGDRSAKDYLALVYGKVKPIRGDIDLGLRRDPADRRRVIAARPSLKSLKTTKSKESMAPGAPSLTRYERLATAAAPRPGLSLLRCRLLTGRSHQIRVHLASSGWPIVGDPVYGEPRWSAVVDPALAAALRDLPRQALHAWRLSFTHPATGEAVVIEAPIPPDIAALIARAGMTFGQIFSGRSNQPTSQ